MRLAVPFKADKQKPVSTKDTKSTKKDTNLLLVLIANFLIGESDGEAPALRNRKLELHNLVPKFERL